MKRMVICLAMLAGLGLAVAGWGKPAQAAVTGPRVALATGAGTGGLVEHARTVCGPYGCYYRPGPRRYRPYYAPRPYYRPRYYAPRRYYRPRYYAPRYYAPRYYRAW